MMYKLEPHDVKRIIEAINDKITLSDYTDFDGLLETFKSIYAVMQASNQSCVYIVGRDPNKL